MGSVQKGVDLKKLPNIGEKTMQRLLEIGIETPEQLSELGPEEIFLRIFEKNGWEQGMCSCFLYALEGAITGERWNEISEKRKKELVAFVHSVRKSLPGMT
jgi:DNA transformation protein and related proteins